MKLEEITCAHCGVKFLARPAAKRIFCSHKCYSADKKKPVERVCGICGTTFITTEAEVKRGGGKYCSRKCFCESNKGDGNPAWAGGDFILKCTNCGRDFRRPRTWTKSGNEVFCCQDCRTENLRKFPEKSPHWKNGATAKHELERKSWRYITWRDAVYKRDDYTCQKCGKRGGRLQAHHLYKFSDYPELRYHVENGHTLCRECHLALKSHERDYLIEIGLDPDKPPFQLTLLPSWDVLPKRKRTKTRHAGSR